MLDELVTNTKSISSFVDSRTKAVDAVARNIEELKEEVARSVRKVDTLCVTSEYTSTVVKAIQVSLSETKKEVVQLKTEVMEIETKTGEEIKQELPLRRTKVDTVCTKVEGVHNSVTDLKVVMDGTDVLWRSGTIGRTSEALRR